MKVQLELHQAPSLGKLVMRLMLVGGIALGCVYGFLMLCSSAIKIFQ